MLGKSYVLPMSGNAFSDRPESGKVATVAEPISIGVPEIARRLSVTDRQVWSLISNRSLPSFKIGRRRLVEVADLHAYIKRLKAEEAEASAARSA